MFCLLNTRILFSLPNPAKSSLLDSGEVRVDHSDEVRDTVSGFGVHWSPMALERVMVDGGCGGGGLDRGDHGDDSGG